MNLKLENGYYVNLPVRNKHNIFFGPNKIGKTQISLSLKKHYETVGEKILLFNDNILNDMVIENKGDINSFEIMPLAQEFNKYNTEVNKYKEKLSIKNELKKLCLVNTKTAFQGFNRVTNYLNEDVFSYDGDVNFSKYNENDLQNMYKPKEIELNIFKIIEKIKKDNVRIIPDNIMKLTDYDIYKIQKRVIDTPEKYKECPVCYSTLTEESFIKIRESVENGSIDKELQLSILFYLDNKNVTLKNIMIEILLCDSHDEYEKKFYNDVEDSIIFHLSKKYDKKDIISYNENHKKVDDILNKIAQFKIKDDIDLINYVKKKLKRHSVYKNEDIDVTIKDGKLKVINTQVEYNKMSKSEQNFFKFLYFDILVHQKVSEGKVHLIVDDPFDSYDDIYVHDSISIISKLIEENITSIDTIDIFSHSMYILDLYSELKNNYCDFKIYWMDQIKGTNEIKIFDDKYELLTKILINPYDYGIIIKISDKMVDKYSLVAFSALLRNEINIEKLLLEKNSNAEISNVKLKIGTLYDKISETIDHIKQNATIKELNDSINELFYYNLIDSDLENVSDIFDDVSNNYSDLDIKVKTRSGNIVLAPKDDVCYLLIYKVLFGLKIRRLLEKKAFDIVKTNYKEVGELIEKIPNSKLYDYYYLYKYIINAFNHSSSMEVPPVFVYSFKSLQDMYDELIKI